VAPARRRWRSAAALGFVVALGAGLAWTWIPGPVGASPSVRRFVLDPQPHRLFPGHVALSRDGRTLVYAAVSDGRTALYVRPFDQLVPRVIEGTDDGSYPILSPDGRWLAFFTRGRLRKVALAPGATPVTLAEVPNDPIDHSVAWLSDDSIVFGVPARDEAVAGLWRVPAEGGVPERLTIPDLAQGEIDHHTPRPLVGSREILVTRHKGAEAYDVAVLRLDTRELKVVVPDAFDARYLPTGHLLYARGSSLYAAPFDADRLEVTGPAVVMLDRVQTALGNGAARYEVADDGTLVVVPPLNPVGRGLAWIGDGRAERLPIEGRVVSRPSLSPNGTHIAMQVDEEFRRDIYVYDPTPRTLVRLTTDGVSEAPHWTPDGKRVTFSRTLQGRRELYWQPVDGSAPAERLVTDGFSVFAGGWSSDGQTLAILRQPPTDLNEIGVYRVQLQRSLAIAVEAHASHPHLSPDGRWVAYTSGEGEITVAALEGGLRRQITSEGGSRPVWGPGGRLHFVRRNSFYSVDLSQFPRVIGRAELTAREVQLVGGGAAHAGYAVAPDGRLLVALPGPREAEPPHFEVAFNWLEEVKQRTGQK
jgi:Tol biopolymer transport system component